MSISHDPVRAAEREIIQHAIALVEAAAYGHSADSVQRTVNAIRSHATTLLTASYQRELRRRTVVRRKKRKTKAQPAKLRAIAGGAK